MVGHGQKKKIAAWVGMTPSMYSHFLGGQRPSLVNAVKYAEKTGIDIKDWAKMPHDGLVNEVKRRWEEKNKKRGSLL